MIIGQILSMEVKKSECPLIGSLAASVRIMSTRSAQEHRLRTAAITSNAPKRIVHYRSRVSGGATLDNHLKDRDMSRFEDPRADMWNSASSASSIAWWSFVAASVFGAVAMLAGFIRGVVANRAADLAKVDADQRIAGADARAAEAKLETADIWLQVGWRRISREKADALKMALQGSKFSVWTTFVGADPEATIFRNELDAALVEAGLETKFFSGWERAVGLKIAGSPSAERDRLAAAFAAARLLFTIEGPGEFAKDDLVIIVGTKPEPV